MRNYLILLLFIFGANISHAQKTTSNLNILVLPYHSEDICHAYNEMKLVQREGIDVISQEFRNMGMQAGSFTAVMRKAKNAGACDTYNPTKMLNMAMKIANSQYYATVETDYNNSTPNTLHIILSLMVYEVGTHTVVSQQTSEAQMPYTKSTRELVQEAFNKMKLSLFQDLPLQKNDNPNINQAKIIDAKGKIKANLVSEVDKNLPKALNLNPDAIAVVIGNANYEKTKSVAYALNDAKSIKNYLVTSFGLQEANIFYIEDARKSDFELMFGVKGNAKGKLYNSIKPNKSEVNRHQIILSRAYTPRDTKKATSDNERFHSRSFNK